MQTKIIKKICFTSLLFIVHYLQPINTFTKPQEKWNEIIGKDPIFYQTKSQSFEKFVSWTNEKTKIAKEVLKVVGKKKGSLLDIGAGNGKLTNLLESNFTHITAVEPSIHMFNLLTTNCCSDKYTLINETFEKIKLKNKFDFILASHSFRHLDNPIVEIYHIKNLLKNSGQFLLLDLSLDCDFLKFYRKYEQDVLGTNSTSPIIFDYKSLLSKAFNNIKEVHFTAILSIPSTAETINLFDFFYGIEFNKIKKETLLKIKYDLEKKYGKGPVKIKFQQIMYVCSK